MKLFRWEKEEKIRPAAKLWVAAVLLPFLIMGVYQWLHKTPAPKPSSGAMRVTKVVAMRQS